MAQPPKYQRKKDFALDEPSAVEVGAINSEFDAVAITVEGLRKNLALIQTDEGGLQNSIVDYDSLAPDVISIFEGVVTDAQSKASESAILAERYAQEAKQSENAVAVNTDKVARLTEAVNINADLVRTNTARTVDAMGHALNYKDLAQAAAVAASNSQQSSLNSMQAAAASAVSADTSANKAKASEQLAKTSEDNAFDSATNAANSAALAEGYASDARTVVAIQDEVVTVAHNIEPVKTTAGNIDAVNATYAHLGAIGVVASDYVTSIEVPNSHDFGVFGTDSIPQSVPKGGSISTVADNIEDVKTVASNMETVQNASQIVVSLEESITRVETAASTLDANQQGALDAATTAVQSRDSAQASATSANTSMVNAQNAENMAKAWATSSTKPDGVLESSKTYAEQAKVSETNAHNASESAQSANTSAQQAKQEAESLVSKARSAVLYDPQTLTETQKAQARTNIGLGALATQGVDFGTWSN